MPRTWTQPSLHSFLRPKEEKGKAKLQIEYEQKEYKPLQPHHSPNKEEERQPMKSAWKPVAHRGAPAGWQEVWNRIVLFRAEHQAPVDTMGCGSMADRSAAPDTQRFQTLVGLMLSSQTRDQSTAKAMRQLQANLGGGVTVDSVIAAPLEEVQTLIKPVTYYTQKAKNIKRVAEILRTQYRGDIPSTYKGLIDLPGVGPKMSHLCMQYAWDKTEGIGVDVHVHRISNRLGWARATTPEGSRKQLEEWLPREHWKTINNLLVGFGQLICTPTYPKCAECPVKELCPTGRANLSLPTPTADSVK